jgi:hypothetical protein
MINKTSTMRKQSVPSIATRDAQGNQLYVVTDRIAGNIGGKAILAQRGDKVYLSVDAAKIFKDRILEV